MLWTFLWRAEEVALAGLDHRRPVFVAHQTSPDLAFCSGANVNRWGLPLFTDVTACVCHVQVPARRRAPLLTATRLQLTLPLPVQGCSLGTVAARAAAAAALSRLSPQPPSAQPQRRDRRNAPSH